MTTLVAARPTPSATPAWRFPAVERQQVGAVEVVAAHLPARPLVQVVVLLQTGANADPEGHEGIASLLGSAVLRGAGGRDEHGLAVAFERVGAVPSAVVRYERTELSLEVPGALLGEALGLLADVLRTPTLADDEVGRVRDARVDRLLARHTDASFRAGRAAARNLWDEASRWSVGSSGRVESLRAIEPADVVAFHRARWADAPVKVVVAGDLTGVDLAASVTPLAGAADAPPEAGAVARTAADDTRIDLVDVPGAVQSVLEVWAPGPSFGEGDEPGLDIAATALFGSFSSRLNLRLREELGYTYGANGGFVRLRDGGWSRAGCSVRTEVTADAVAELVAVLRAGVADGLTEAEVTQARDNLVRRFPVRYDGPGAVAGALVSRVHHDLDDDERDRRLAELREVDAPRATEALRAALAADELAITVAGSADEVRPGLRDLDLGTVTDVD